MRDSIPTATDRAIGRLEGALRLLEAALERRLEQSGGSEDLAAEVQSLSTDRARLAEMLDQAQARVARLENLNREASRRVGVAMESIETVLASSAEEA